MSKARTDQSVDVSWLGNSSEAREACGRPPHCHVALYALKQGGKFTEGLGLNQNKDSTIFEVSVSDRAESPSR